MLGTTSGMLLVLYSSCTERSRRSGSKHQAGHVVCSAAAAVECSSSSWLMLYSYLAPHMDAIRHKNKNNHNLLNQHIFCFVFLCTHAAISSSSSSSSQ